MPISEWTSDRLGQLNAAFEHRSPREILAWAGEEFGQGAVMGTGFGASGVVLMHILASVRPETTVFYLDTDLLFPETYELRDRLAVRLGLNIVRVHSGLSLEKQRKEYGDELWKRDPDRCCFLRKVKPLQDYLAHKDAWITAIRRDQSPARAITQVVEWNRINQVVKINPLATWTEEDIWTYIRAHDLPYNPLHDRGYPSIGCVPCTRPITNGSTNLRAGRWVGTSKTECGLHVEA